MNQQILWEQLARYFAGECTQQEEQDMKSWIEADPRREEQVGKLYEIWKESGSTPHPVSVDEAWALLSQNIDRFEEKKATASKYTEEENRLERLHEHRRTRESVSGIRRVVITAAAAILLIATGLYIYFGENINTGQETGEIAVRQFEAAEGERAVFTLNDGSRVILHAESRLEVPVSFNSNHRELKLVGEAWFEVTHHIERPFIVHSGNAQTRVLGTKFLVQAWPEKAETEVVVAEGRVALGEASGDNANTDNRPEIIVTENQKGSLVPGKAAVATDISEADMQFYLGWTEGRLIFAERPFREIIPRLERWYVVDIRLEDSRIGDEKLTAEIDYNQPMSEVLAAITLTLNLELERDDRTVLFRYKE